jgi:hypothetical protein
MSSEAPPDRRYEVVDVPGDLLDAAPRRGVLGADESRAPALGRESQHHASPEVAKGPDARGKVPAPAAESTTAWRTILQPAWRDSQRAT